MIDKTVNKQALHWVAGYWMPVIGMIILFFEFSDQRLTTNATPKDSFRATST